MNAAAVTELEKELDDEVALFETSLNELFQANGDVDDIEDTVINDDNDDAYHLPHEMPSTQTDLFDENVYSGPFCQIIFSEEREGAGLVASFLPMGRGPVQNSVKGKRGNRDSSLKSYAYETRAMDLHARIIAVWLCCQLV